MLCIPLALHTTQDVEKLYHSQLVFAVQATLICEDQLLLHL